MTGVWLVFKSDRSTVLTLIRDRPTGLAWFLKATGLPTLRLPATGQKA